MSATGSLLLQEERLGHALVLHAHAEAEAAQRLPKEQNRTTARRVEEALEKGFLDAKVGIEHIAGALHMSRRTLQRRLADEGATFEGVLDSLRRRIALEVLARKQMSPAELSFTLGYSDSKAFHRALKRWRAGGR